MALALLSQSLRLIIPLPNMVSMFLIGSLVGLCMLVAAMRYGLASGLGIAWATPVIAFMQAMLPFAPFVPLVALGNTVFVILGYLLKNQSVWLQALCGQMRRFILQFCPAVCRLCRAVCRLCRAISDWTGRSVYDELAADCDGHVGCCRGEVPFESQLTGRQ